MTTLTLSHVEKRYTQQVVARDARTSFVEVQALHDINLRLASGRVLAIVGPSGCGKSTLLRVIAGLIAPDSGQVLYDNVPLSEIPLRERGVGMVFQEGALMPHWEARRNIGFFLWLRRREAEVPERMRQVAAITGIGLEHLMGRLPRHLSGGERQRVAVARALARDPRIFLFDEPFSNLDAKFRAQARVELRRLLNAFRVTTVFVTHDQAEAVALADLIAVMRSGRIEQVDRYDGLYHNPVNLFVAAFIGSPPINTFAGHVERGTWRGTHFSHLPLRADLTDGTPVLLALRPDAFELDAQPGVAVRVESVTNVYEQRAQWVQVATIHLPLERWTMHVPDSRRVRVGEQIAVRCALERALFFDAHTERRIG
jgi:ABC-type sugar transport system ATPase subunit